MTHEQGNKIAQAYAATKPGLIRCQYVGGSKIAVSPLLTSSCVVRFITTKEARKAVARRTGKVL